MGRAAAVAMTCTDHPEVRASVIRVSARGAGPAPHTMRVSVLVGAGSVIVARRCDGRSFAPGVGWNAARVGRCRRGAGGSWLGNGPLRARTFLPRECT